MLNSCEEQLPVHLAVVAASKYYAVDFQTAIVIVSEIYSNGSKIGTR